ncbi:MAG: hypothetical protein NUW00_00735 [Candidatus Kaiserbacteria bacterium]|nr:hypothetical protein [Candidatus Kaiserbacteria bacterium]
MREVRGKTKFLIEPYRAYGEKRILGASQEAVDIFLKENIIQPEQHL